MRVSVTRRLDGAKKLMVAGDRSVHFLTKQSGSLFYSRLDGLTEIPTQSRAVAFPMNVARDSWLRQFEPFDLAVSGERVFAVWEDVGANGTALTIRYAQSDDGGQTFVTRTLISAPIVGDKPLPFAAPKVAIHGDDVVIAFQDRRGVSGTICTTQCEPTTQVYRGSGRGWIAKAFPSASHAEYDVAATARALYVVFGGINFYSRIRVHESAGGQEWNEVATFGAEGAATGLVLRSSEHAVVAAYAVFNGGADSGCAPPTASMGRRGWRRLAAVTEAPSLAVGGRTAVVAWEPGADSEGPAGVATSFDLRRGFEPPVAISRDGERWGFRPPRQTARCI